LREILEGSEGEKRKRKHAEGRNQKTEGRRHTGGREEPGKGDSIQGALEGVGNRKGKGNFVRESRKRIGEGDP